MQNDETASSAAPVPPPPPVVQAVAIPKALQFAFGGAAGMAATCVVQPIDLIKTRMQLAGVPVGSAPAASFAVTARTIAAREGLPAMYRGLSAGLFRQVTYTTARLGVFGIVKDALAAAAEGGGHKNKKKKPLPFAQKALAGMVAGACGAVVGTPAEVALIRMTADGRLPKEQQRGYTSVFNALARVVREEGVATLWRGTLPTVGRAMVLNIAQLASYDQAKEYILASGVVGDNIGAHALASTCSGFLATAVSIPFDNAKTRVQNMKVVNGKGEYSGMLDALAKTVRQEGVLSLWRGFTPYFLRLGPHTVLTFVALEQMKSAYLRRQQDRQFR
jgi:solute carrier family 25 (mitochondrial oxoglutarate transporter), member 11